MVIAGKEPDTPRPTSWRCRRKKRIRPLFDQRDRPGGDARIPRKAMYPGNLLKVATNLAAAAFCSHLSTFS
jgi:hypothetical protein